MNDPTDDEIKDLYAQETGFILDDSPAALLDFARAVLAKWGTPAPVGVEPAEFSRFLSDVLTAAGLVTHGKQCKALGERLADMCMKLRIHGIKGGQHGADT